MKIRIGIGLGTTGADEFTDAVDRMEAAGVDSLWLSEVVHGPIVDPFVGMAHALARTTNLKVGTGVSVLPGRHPVLVAKQIASLAALTPKRVLPVFGLRPARRGERYLFPAPPGERAALFDESMELLRLALRQERFDFQGRYFTVEDATVGPLPAKPVDIWLGGSAPAGLRRTGRYGDGWLASFMTPDQARAGRETIERAAAEAGREIEDDHYGISLAISLDGTIPDAFTRAARERHPDADPRQLVGLGWADTRRKIERYVDAGLTKFVVRPVTPVPLPDFLEGFTTELQSLEN